MSGKKALRKLTPIPSALLIALLVNGLLVALIYKLQPAWLSHFEATELLGIGIGISMLTTGFTLWLLNQLFLEHPLKKMIALVQSAEQRDFLLRVPVRAHDTLGKLADSFNKMLERITTLDAFKLETERELIAAQHELKYKQVLEEKNRHLTLLYDISRTFSGSLDSDDLYQEILAIVGLMLDYDELVLMMPNEDEQNLQVVATYGIEEAEQLMGMVFDKGEGITGEAILTKKPIYVPDTGADSRYLHYKGHKPEDVSFYSVPILGPAGERVLGVLNVSRPASEPFRGQERETLQAVSHLIGMEITNARSFAAMKEQSVRDRLTRLYNRRHGEEALQREVKRASRFGRQFGALMIDIDHFKQYNDVNGHPQGDKALREFGSLLQTSLRDVDYVARWGGEEFLVILPNTDAIGTLNAANKICRNVRRHPFHKRSHQPLRHFSVSIGAATFPNDAQNADTLVECADQALYEAKETGRDRVVTASTSQRKQQTG